MSPPRPIASRRLSIQAPGRTPGRKSARLAGQKSGWKLDPWSGRVSGQSGVTLIELMIALLISSLLIGLVFAVYARMSVAYRSQQGVSELQQTLRTAKAQIVGDLREAGHLIPQGFEASDAVEIALTTATTLDPLPPIQVLNNPDVATWADPALRPDKLRVYYADASKLARITLVGSPNDVVVDDSDQFRDGDLVLVIDQPTTSANDAIPDGGAGLAEYNACLVRITSIVGPGLGATINFASEGHYNTVGNGHCAAGEIAVDSLIYGFVARSYRIDPDPARRDRAVLQVHRAGELDATPWDDLGMGFTDLQLTQRVYHDPAPAGPGGEIDLDGDGDPFRNWYSGIVPPAPMTSSTLPAEELVKPLVVGVSMAVRTIRDLNVVPTAQTPRFTDGNPDHNPLGDSAEVVLDGSQPDLLQGKHIYRYFSVRVDLRNLGVGHE